MRAVLDPNVIISALLAPEGSPAKVLRAWLDGAYELVASPLLLQALERALAYPKLQARLTEGETQELVDLLRREADLRDDPLRAPPWRSSDPGDDYLIGSGGLRARGSRFRRPSPTGPGGRPSGLLARRPSRTLGRA